MSVSKKTTALSKKQFLNAYIENMGQVVLTCQQLKVGLTTFYQWKKSDPKFKEKIDEGAELTLDMAEQCLLNNMVMMKESSNFFYLKKKGASKGYGEATASDYVKLPEWRNAKTPQDKMVLIDEALAENKISPAQAQSLGAYVANAVNVEIRIDNIEKGLEELKHMFIKGGGDA